MGFVKFQSRSGDHHHLVNHILNDLDDEGLPEMQVGDSVVFEADIDPETYLRLAGQPQDGVYLRKKPPMPYTNEPGYVIEIQFWIKQRRHTITRGRGDDIGFRTYGVTVCLEADSDAAEAAFMALQPALSESE